MAQQYAKKSCNRSQNNLEWCHIQEDEKEMWFTKNWKTSSGTNFQAGDGTGYNLEWRLRSRNNITH